MRPDAHAAPADFLLNISNDGWFDGTSEHDEHLSICRFRAVECRRAIARAVNMGISAVIDGSGRVLSPMDSTNRKASPFVWKLPPGSQRATDLPVHDWWRFKKVQGVLQGPVPIDHRTSFYAQWGDWLPQICWLLIGFGLITPTLSRLARKSTAFHQNEHVAVG
jgi:apolipoprotein N-acyltransferase